MNETLDLITIGAINFDCIFFTKKRKRDIPQNYESGIEVWIDDRNVLYEDIYTLRSNNSAFQVGGSAFLALKAAHTVDSTLKVAHVGVCGKPLLDDKRMGYEAYFNGAFDFLDNTEWLFYDSAPVGLALVELNKRNERDRIRIHEGANDSLINHILEKEERTGESFVDYLSNAKWIHITSLKNIEQFMFFIDKVCEAKKANPFLKLSIDPGNYYVTNEKKKLVKAFEISNYVFMNEQELKGLIGDEKASEELIKQKLSYFFSGASIAQVFVEKKIGNEVLYSLKNGKIETANFWHKKIRKKKIKNDTGAGDAFAGGFIAAILSDKYIIHQPFPVEVGAIAAAARLTNRDNPYDTMKKNIEMRVNIMNKMELLNRRQKIDIYLKYYREKWASFCSGVLITLISTFIIWIFQLFFFH